MTHRVILIPWLPCPAEHIGDPESGQFFLERLPSITDVFQFRHRRRAGGMGLHLPIRPRSLRRSGTPPAKRRTVTGRHRRTLVNGNRSRSQRSFDSVRRSPTRCRHAATAAWAGRAARGPVPTDAGRSCRLPPALGGPQGPTHQTDREQPQVPPAPKGQLAQEPQRQRGNLQRIPPPGRWRGGRTSGRPARRSGHAGRGRPTNRTGTPTRPGRPAPRPSGRVTEKVGAR